MTPTKRTIRIFAAVAAAACMAATAAPAAAQAPSREDAALLEAYGGVYAGPLSDYVARVGERVAVAAGQPAGRCAFAVVNSDVVNAFATPRGCHVYVTRGLLSVINSEAELASVLGHEVGHVAANHAGRRQQRSVLGGLGAVVVGAITGSSQLA